MLALRLVLLAVVATVCYGQIVPATDPSVVGCFYKDKHGSGLATCFGPNTDFPDLGAIKNTWSSYRHFDLTRRFTVCSGTYYSSRCKTLRHPQIPATGISITDFTEQSNFDNNIESIRTEPVLPIKGWVVIYKDSDYTGKAFVVTPGTYNTIEDICDGFSCMGNNEASTIAIAPRTRAVIYQNTYLSSPISSYYNSDPVSWQFWPISPNDKAKSMIVEQLYP